MANVGLKIFQTLLLPLQRLPLGFHYFWGRVLSRMASRLFHYRRDVIVQNISRSFPDKKYGEVADLVEAAYRHIGEIFAEAMWFGGCRNRPERLHRQHLCEISDPEQLVGSMSARPGVMLLGSHFGNWEIFGGIHDYLYDNPEAQAAITGDNVCVVYKKLNSRFWNAFMAGNRCAAVPGFKGYLETREVLRYAIRHRDEDKLYLFLTDQFPYRGATRHEVPDFMNQKTLAMTGGAALACRLGMAVYYLSIDRVSRGRYRMSFRRICEDASSMEPGAVMEKYYSFLEEDVKANPENYLWSHKRWK